MSSSSSGRPLPLHNHSNNKRSSLTMMQILSCLAFMLASFYSGLMLGLKCTDQKCQECLNDHSSVKREYIILCGVMANVCSHECVFSQHVHSFLGSIEQAKTEMMNLLQKEKIHQSGIEQAKTEIIHAIIENNHKQVDSVGNQNDNAMLLKSFKDDLLRAIEKLSKPVQQDEHNTPTDEPLIPVGMRRLFAGMARVDRDDFFEKHELGVPKDESITGNTEVLLLYSNEKALPEQTNNGVDMPLLSADDATEQCNTLKVVLTEPHKKKECLALVGQWESYHVQKYMRLPQDDAKKKDLDESLPLRHVSRLHIDSGLAQRIPTPEKVKEYNALMIKYLSSLDIVLDELKPLAKKVAKDNTIIVMVCNHGQSELLMNFVCSSRARGFDLSQVLVFATDTETKELAEGLGLVSFYDHTVCCRIVEYAYVVCIVV